MKKYFFVVFCVALLFTITGCSSKSQITCTSKDSLKIYYCDLGNKLNRDYYNVNNDNKSNPNAKSIKELDLGDLTLIKVEKGKITKYIEKYDSIKNELK